MGDFTFGSRRWVRVGVAVAVVVLFGLAAGLWIGYAAAPTVAAPVSAGSVGVPVPPPWPATFTPRPAAGPVDAGQGWRIPNPGAAGPFSVTDQGVPYGYRQDLDGAALAAVNAVVAGRYLAVTFPDPWSALGFLADPRYADRGGNPSLETFFTGPVRPQVVGVTAAPTTNPAADPAVTPAAAAGPAGGGRVVGVQTTPAAVPEGAVQAVVLWQSFSAEYRPDGQQGYTVRIAPVTLLLVWVDGDWKVTRVGGPPVGMDTFVLGGVVPLSFPVPAEDWHR